MSALDWLRLALAALLTPCLAVCWIAALDYCRRVAREIGDAKGFALAVALAVALSLFVALALFAVWSPMLPLLGK